jgi:hypothetical protein
VIKGSQWSYVQARLQARHGERLHEGDWRALEATRAVDQYIERSRSTSLRRFTDHLNAKMSSHTMEGMLRMAWRSYVAEIAGWVVPTWKPAVEWVAHVPELPVIDVVLKGKAPGWTGSDPVFGALAEGDPQQQVPSRRNLRLVPLYPARVSDELLAQRWLTHWRSLWPQHRGPDYEWLAKLSDAVKDHVQRLDQAGIRDTSSPYRHDLAHHLTRIFRRRSGTPVAVFCHLALVALDLERLRGGLVRRQLFEPGTAAGAP